MDLFVRKPRVIPTFDICFKESLEELDFDPDTIAKFEFSETPPWTYPTTIVNLILSYARNFIIFSDTKSALLAISGQDWTHPLVLDILECLHWLVQYQEKRILFYLIPSHVGIIGNEEADTAAKAGLLRRVTNVPILMMISRSTSMSL